MGTMASFTLFAAPCAGESKEVIPAAGVDGKLRAALGEACYALHRADAVFSTWDPASPMSRLRRGNASMAEMPPEVAEVLALCEFAREASRGWFDPWAMPGGLDPTGLVKGWAVEHALSVLENATLNPGRPNPGPAAPGPANPGPADSGPANPGSAGPELQGADRHGCSLLTGAMLDVGGDIATFGAPGTSEEGGKWRVGIRNPWDPHALACILETDAAVATSGTYERGEILIDPRTGEPACRCASATVTGPSLAMADALATALAVAGADGMDWFGSLAGYEAYLILPDATALMTQGLDLAGQMVAVPVPGSWSPPAISASAPRSAAAGHLAGGAIPPSTTCSVGGEVNETFQGR